MNFQHSLELQLNKKRMILSLTFFNKTLRDPLNKICLFVKLLICTMARKFASTGSDVNGYWDIMRCSYWLR